MTKILEQKKNQINQRGLMSYPSDDEQDSLRQEGIALLMKCFIEPPIIQLPYNDIKVKLRKEIGSQMAYYLSIGDYEQNDLDLITRYIKKGDKVMEMGGGIGVTGSLLGKVSENKVTIIEANPLLPSLIQETFDLNNVGLNLIQACAVSDNYKEENITFHVSSNYWWSSLIPSEGFNAITAKAKSFSSLMKEHEPTILVIDIEGAEKELFPCQIHESINMIFIEIHTPSIGTEETSKIVANLTQQGYHLKDIGAYTWVFEKAK